MSLKDGTSTHTADGLTADEFIATLQANGYDNDDIRALGYGHLL